MYSIRSCQECDWYNIYDKEQLKADIEDAYHSQEITN